MLTKGQGREGNVNSKLQTDPPRFSRPSSLSGFLWYGRVERQLPLPFYNPDHHDDVYHLTHRIQLKSDLNLIKYI